MSRKSRLLVIPPQHLGHELHVGRSIVCDMLRRGFISPELGDSVITGLPDRKFFYQELFGSERVLDFSELPGIRTPIQPPKTLAEYLDIESSFFLNIPRFKNFDCINLKDYAAPPTYCTFTTNDEMKAIGYEVPSKYFDEEFIKISKKFNFFGQDEVNEIVPQTCQGFVVVHHRYGASIENLSRLLSEFPEQNYKVIFTSDVAVVARDLKAMPNVSFVDSLRCYATLLNDPRCQLLISEWSGGGQIAQYTLGAQGLVCYYYGHYSDIFNFTRTHKIWELNATLGTYFNCWDFKCVSGCAIRHFPDFQGLNVAIQSVFGVKR